jgi:hypothetical protein
MPHSKKKKKKKKKKKIKEKLPCEIDPSLVQCPRDAGPEQSFVESPVVTPYLPRGHGRMTPRMQ